jgi:hypothetical protein
MTWLTGEVAVYGSLKKASLPDGGFSTSPSTPAKAVQRLYDIKLITDYLVNIYNKGAIRDESVQ